LSLKRLEIEKGGDNMILDILAESSRKRVNELKAVVSLDELKARIYNGNKVKSFHQREEFALEHVFRENRAVSKKGKNETGEKGFSLICEVKKASPSKGEIAKDFPYLEIAKEYEKGGAAAISVLTEPEYFKGNNGHLTEISSSVSIPVLRKDFTVDEYQIYEAKLIGADAVLLICALLDKDTLKEYISICNELGLSTLVEVHSEEEIKMALEAGARIIGVNNRNLQTFQVDFNHCINLKKLIPPDIIFIAESGIQKAEDISALKAAGADGALIGETLMRSKDKREMMAYLQGKNHS
jgi:indole-3-glycerol phosphate synthase